MLAFFPRLLPGEIVQSAVSRLATSLGLQMRSQCMAMLDLRGEGTSWSHQTFVPAQLATIARVLPECHPQKNVSVLLNDHTLFPALTYFMDPEKRAEVQSDIERNLIRHADLSIQLGVTHWNRRDTPVAWRYCDQCAIDDLDDFGVSYYHREHQFPGVFVCWKHGEPLKHACHLCAAGQNSHGFPKPPAPNSTCVHAHAKPLADQLPDGLTAVDALNIAKSAAFMCSHAPRLDARRWSAEIKTALHSRYSHTLRFDTDVISSAFVDRFGEPIRKMLSCRATRKQNDASAWVVGALSYYGEGQHPLTRILLVLLVSASIAEFESIALDSVIGVTLSTAYDDRWAPDWIPQLRRLIEDGVEKSAIADRFKISIRDLSVLVARLGIETHKKHLPPAQLARAIKLIQTGEPVSAISKRYRVKVETLLQELGRVDLAFTQQIAASIFTTKQDRFRAQIARAIKCEMSLTELHRNLGAAMLWLYKYDTKWIESSVLRIQGGLRPSPPRQLAVDDDLQCADRVDAAAGLIKSYPNHERVTCSVLFEAAGLSSMVRKLPDRYPHTHRAILSHVESTEDYGLRKLEWVISELAQKFKFVSSAEIASYYQVPNCLKNRRASLISSLAAKHGLQLV